MCVILFKTKILTLVKYFSILKVNKKGFFFDLMRKMTFIEIFIFYLNEHKKNIFCVFYLLIALFYFVSLCNAYL